MTKLRFDHLVIGAASLAQGVGWVEAELGVTLPPGGTHPRMGTHNRLTAVGPASFLEIIAVDPAAEPPPRPRWFALDDPAERARLEQSPRLLTWVAGTDDIAASLTRARNAGVDLGRPVEMTRGDLTWLISIRDDGALAEGGTLPALIQWPQGRHPASAMTDLGLRLESLELGHPDPAGLAAVLRAMGAGPLAAVVRGEQPSLRAVLRASEAPGLGPSAARGRAEIS
jgi:hypothetical protein